MYRIFDIATCSMHPIYLKTIFQAITCLCVRVCVCVHACVYTRSQSFHRVVLDIVASPLVVSIVISLSHSVRSNTCVASDSIFYWNKRPQQINSLVTTEIINFFFSFLLSRFSGFSSIRRFLKTRFCCCFFIRSSCSGIESVFCLPLVFLFCYINKILCSRLGSMEKLRCVQLQSPSATEFYILFRLCVFIFFSHPSDCFLFSLLSFFLSFCLSLMEFLFIRLK